MRTPILTIITAALFAACSPKSSDQALAKQSSPDTTGFSEFRDWKEKQALVVNEANQQSFNTDAVTETSEAPAELKEAKPKVIYRTVPARTRSVARRTTTHRSSAPVAKRTSTSRSSIPSSSPSTESSSGNGTTVSNGDIAGTSPSELPQTKEKKGWSKAAKGTVIGAGSGAVLGAIISKDKTKGAVIGGIVGAAGGYVFGRAQDKKDGRY